MINWTIVERALAISRIDPAAAELLLATAGTVTDPDLPLAAVIYGRDGYSDLNDPRDLACRRHAFQDGRPVGIHLQVHVRPERPLRCTRVELVERDDSCNVYFTITSREGHVLPAYGCRLASPYSGDERFDHLWDAPASPSVIFMGRDAAFVDPNLGPLAAVVVNSNDQIISDVVASLGLLRGTHWSFRVYFQERE